VVWIHDSLGTMVNVALSSVPRGMSPRPKSILLLLVGMFLLLTGCSDFVDHDQVVSQEERAIFLTAGETVGQTFVAQHGGLDGIELWVAPHSGAEGRLVLHLRAEPGADEDIAVGELPLDNLTAGFHRFVLPPDAHSHGLYRYAFLEFIGKGAVDVGAAPGDAYLNGAAYLNHEPLNAQLAFHLTYDRDLMVREFMVALLQGVGLLIIGGLLYLLPGYALLAWLWPVDLDLPWPSRMGIAAGLSVAIYPLLMLWTDIVKLHIGAGYAWLPVGGSLIALGWRYRVSRGHRLMSRFKNWIHSTAFMPDILYLIVLGLGFGVRLLAVRTLDAPMWGDSYQHTMIVQLLIDHNGLFTSWQPYADMVTFTYHFGFHASVAAFHWLTGMDAVHAVIWVGQLMNGLAAMVVLYPLAYYVSGGRWGGTFAALTAGLLLRMPMFYVNWGRYTQLAGQVILPVAALLTWTFFTVHRDKWVLLTLAALSVGGLALTHYRVLLFYGAFVAALWVSLWGRWRVLAERAVLLGVAGGALFSPWFWRVFSGRIPRLFGQLATTTPTHASSFVKQYNQIGGLAFGLPHTVWVLLCLALGVGLWHHRRGMLLLSSWGGLLFLVTNPDWLGLPGIGIISNFALGIAFYIVASVAIGYLATEVLEAFPKIMGGIVVLIILIALWGAKTRLKDIQTASHALVTRPDVQAMAWIETHLPQDACFLINSMPAYGESVVVGVDGGWWLPLLAHRANTVPPLTYGFEQGPRPDYHQWVKKLTIQIANEGTNALTTLAMLHERGVTYVYLGQQQRYSGVERVTGYAPEMFSDQYYRLIYHQDHVYIFKIVSWGTQ